MSQQQATLTSRTNGFLSINQIIGDKKNAPIIPVSKTTFFALIKRGIIPKPVKILSRNYYHIDTVNNIVASLNSGAGATA